MWHNGQIGSINTRIQLITPSCLNEGTSHNVKVVSHEIEIGRKERWIIVSDIS